MDFKISGQTEELILMAVRSRMTDGMTAMEVRRIVEEATDKRQSNGALYTTLRRLEEKGLVESTESAGDDSRGGLPRYFYRLTGAGSQALRDTELARTKIGGVSFGV